MTTTSERANAAGAAGGPVDVEGEGLMSHRQVLVVFTGLMLGMFLAALDQSVVGTALPTIVGDFHALNRLTWVVTAYLVTSTASAPLYGKISDLYGRKRIFQIAIVVFLVGSVLAGLSQNMNELIAFRGLQGLGAGGLIVIATAIVGDVVTPAERGRYQGYFGAVWGLASVAGPLVGGFLVEQISWRWIFYVNLPIGAAALIVTSIVLKDRSERTRHRIDYPGSLLLLCGVSALLLTTTLGGSPQGFAWGSWQIMTILLAGVSLLVAFVFWEMRTPEPIVPMYLFRKRIFTAANAAGFIIGAAMFGTIIYLPVYLQVVKGVSPTISGLMLLPLMVGLLISSIGSGIIIVRIGRYRIFPIMGTVVMTVGLYLLSTLEVGTSDLVDSVYMFVVGFGIGLVMQVLVLAVQNGVEYKDLGTATSLTSFFRSMGGAFGTAVLGAILTDRLDTNLFEALPAPARPHLKQIAQLVVGSPTQLKALGRHYPAIYDAARHAYVHTIDTVFLVSVPLAAASILFTIFMPEIRLRKTIRTGGDKAAGDQAPGAALAGAAEASLA